MTLSPEHFGLIVSAVVGVLGALQALIHAWGKREKSLQEREAKITAVEQQIRNDLQQEIDRLSTEQQAQSKQITELTERLDRAEKERDDAVKRATEAERKLSEALSKSEKQAIVIATMRDVLRHFKVVAIESDKPKEAKESKEHE